MIKIIEKTVKTVKQIIARIHISASNEKTGNIPSFNTLAGDMAHDYDGAKNGDKYAELTKKFGKCSGTCSGDCPGCYAKKITRYPAVLANYAENTWIVKNDLMEFKRQLNAWLNLNWVRVFRFHDSGDIFSLEYFKVICEICAENPATIFYTYTKEVGIIKRFMAQGGIIPANFIINISTWDGCNVDIIPGFNVFHYDDTKNSEMVHCPSVDINGKKTGITCMQCRR